MIPQVGGFQGCYLDNHRNNWRCARAVPALCENAPYRAEPAPPPGISALPLPLPGLIARGAKWSVRRVRLAIEATAITTPNAAGAEVERWSLGRGLLSVPAAHAWLEQHEAEPLADVRFVVRATVTGKGTAQGQHGRGVYLREPQHSAADVECAVQVWAGARPRKCWNGRTPSEEGGRVPRDQACAAAACHGIQFFEFMCLSACSCSVCTGDILPAPCLPSVFLFVLS